MVLPLTLLDLPHEDPMGVTNIVKDLCVALDNAAHICCPKIVDLYGKPHINLSFLRGILWDHVSTYRWELRPLRLVF